LIASFLFRSLMKTQSVSAARLADRTKKALKAGAQCAGPPTLKRIDCASPPPGLAAGSGQSVACRQAAHNGAARVTPMKDRLQKPPAKTAWLA
jgi:hypothetical protein